MPLEIQVLASLLFPIKCHHIAIRYPCTVPYDTAVSDFRAVPRRTEVSHDRVRYRGRVPRSPLPVPFVPQFPITEYRVYRGDTET